MPLIGTFHANYWRVSANPPPPPVTGQVQGYPVVQSAIVVIATGAA